MLSIVWEIIKRDLMLSVRHGGETLQIIAFFLLITTFFPLSLGSDAVLLSSAAGAAVWIAALFSIMLTLPNLFERDYADGSLEQLLLAPAAFEWIIFAKLAAHWLANCLPLIIISPAISVMFGLPLEKSLYTPLALVIGTPALIAIGGVGAALLLGHSRSAGLLAILVFPLFIPVLIFGSSLLHPAAIPQAITFAYSFLGVASLIFLPLGIYTSAMIVRGTSAS